MQYPSEYCEQGFRLLALDLERVYDMKVKTHLMIDEATMGFTVHVWVGRGLEIFLNQRFTERSVHTAFNEAWKGLEDLKSQLNWWH